MSRGAKGALGRFPMLVAKWLAIWLGASVLLAVLRRLGQRGF